MNSVNNLEKKSKLIWAIDPFQDAKLATQIIREIKIWAKHLNCEVQPVAVISRSILDNPAELIFSEKPTFEEAASDVTEKYLKNVGAKDLLPAHLIFTSSFSNRKMAVELANYAQKNSARLIVAKTHAKKTWNPVRLGGFAETLAAASIVPVLLFNSSANVSKKISNILFPTNFRQESKVVLLNLANWSKSFNAQVEIFNQVEGPFTYPPMAYSYVPSNEWIAISKQTEEQRFKKAKIWNEVLKTYGFKSDITIRRQRKSLSEDILGYSNKNKVDVIAIVNESSPRTQAWLGSTARDILLQAKCPVLIFHRPQKQRIPFSTSTQADQNFLIENPTPSLYF